MKMHSNNGNQKGSLRRETRLSFKTRAMRQSGHHVQKLSIFNEKNSLKKHPTLAKDLLVLASPGLNPPVKTTNN